MMLVQQIGRNPREPTFLLVVDGMTVGYITTEALSDGLYAPHITTCPGHRRKGYCSHLLDAVIAHQEARGWYIVYEDEPDYKNKYHGVGGCSPDGQAFLDAYRTKRGIPLPPLHYVGCWHPVAREAA